jgi:uncharacterized protein
MLKYKKIILKFLIYSFLFLFTFPNFSFAEKVDDLKIDKYINDYANFLSSEKQAELNQELGNYFASTSNQVVFVSVNNLDGDYIEHYSIKLAEKIKAGDSKKDNGVILLVSKNDRQFRIEVGYGLEPVLTDGFSNQILQKTLKPNFQKGDYEAGISESLNQIIQVLNQDPNLQISSNNSNSSFFDWLNPEVIFLGFFFLISILQWIGAILSRTKSWWLGGIIGFVVGAISFLFLSFIFAWFISVFLSLLGFIFDYFVSKNYIWHVNNPTRRGPPNWWAGSTWGPGSSPWRGGSGGDYTFRGGGGGFGGGGSSGSW